jgi:polyketide synthase PksM
VTIRGTGTLTPLHLVHSLAGELTWLAPLSRLIEPERPLFGFAAPGLNAKGEPFTSMQAMAGAYLAAARARQPRGPYVFGGYSFGGVVAYEMARQAQAANETVDGLILIDSYTPHSTVMSALRRWSREGILVQSVSNMLAVEWKGMNLLASGALPPDDPAGQVARATQHLLETCDVHHSFDAIATLLENCRKVMEAHTSILGAYRPAPPHDRLDALLIHNTHGFIGADNALNLPKVDDFPDRESHGWDGYFINPPLRVPVDTEHFLMMRPPALDKVAAAINSHQG